MTNKVTVTFEVAVTFYVVRREVCCYPVIAMSRAAMTVIYYFATGI